MKRSERPPRPRPRRAVATAALAACLLAGGVDAQQPTARWFDDDAVRAGAEVYARNCARCHGDAAQGAPEWRRRGPDGKFPAPPLDGSGHAWHHPLTVLARVILDGSPGGGDMPAWRGQLERDEVAAVIAWFQSLWPDEVYAAWTDIERRAR